MIAVHVRYDNAGDIPQGQTHRPEMPADIPDAEAEIDEERAVIIPEHRAVACA